VLSSIWHDMVSMSASDVSYEGNVQTNIMSDTFAKNMNRISVRGSGAPRVTVYIVSHNYGRFLEQAIESVFRQYYAKWELLLIDDGSTDETPEIMCLYQGDPRVRVLRTDNIGLPAVANLALREAQGEYLIRLDGDDIFDENLLLVLENYLNIHPECAMVFSDYYLIDEGGSVLSHERRHRLLELSHLKDMPPNGACALTRTSALKEIGGYREDLRAQDGFDLWARIRDTHGVSNVNLPLFHYRRHGHNLTNKSGHILAARRRIKQDATTAMLDRYRPILGVIPCRCLYDFRRNLWAAMLGGRTLLQRKIERTLASSLFDFVIVASDTEEVLQTIEEFSDPRLKYFQREAAETIRSRSLVGTLSRISQAYDDTENGMTVMSYYPSPFVTTESIEEAIYTLAFNDVDSSVGVEEIKEPMYCRTQYGLRPINQLGTFRTDYDYVYREANVAMATKNANFRSGSQVGPVTVNFIVPQNENFYIDSEQKLMIAELLDANGH
jgi:glycosyltransferase involved in cell wall biosynthesis